MSGGINAGGNKMSAIEVRELKREEYKIWDVLVESSPHGTIFHNSDWLTTCSELLNKKLKIYGCFENEELVSGCSLYVYKSKFFKMASSIIKMTPYGGVVLAQSPSSKIREREQAYSNIIKSLCNIFDKEHFDSIQLTNSPDLIDVRPFTWNGWDSKVYYAYYLDLDDDVEKGFSKNARRTIRGAIKNNISVKKLSKDDVERDFLQYYDLFKITYLRQGIQLSVSKEFLKNMIDMLYDQRKGEMWIAKDSSGEMTAAEVNVVDNKRAYRWSPVSHTELRKTGATSLLLFEIFKDLKERGFKEINLMAANTPQLAKFISSFNPKLVPYYSIEKKRSLVKIAEPIYHILRWWGENRG